MPSISTPTKSGTKLEDCSLLGMFSPILSSFPGSPILGQATTKDERKRKPLQEIQNNLFREGRMRSASKDCEPVKGTLLPSVLRRTPSPIRSHSPILGLGKFVMKRSKLHNSKKSTVDCSAIDRNCDGQTAETVCPGNESTTFFEKSSMCVDKAHNVLEMEPLDDDSTFFETSATFVAKKSFITSYDR